MSKMMSGEYTSGYESAQAEIVGESLTPWQAQDHLDVVPAVDGDDFDAGFRAALTAYAKSGS